MHAKVEKSQQAHPLVGSWRLISWQVISEDGTPQDVFGVSARGILC